MKEVKAYQCDCGRKFHTKKAAYLHETFACKCWTNPKFKTCKTCKFGKQVKDSNGMESEPQHLHTWKQWQCSNPLFIYDTHFTAAHENAPDLNINCILWESKQDNKIAEH